MGLGWKLTAGGVWAPDPDVTPRPPPGFSNGVPSGARGTQSLTTVFLDGRRKKPLGEGPERVLRCDWCDREEKVSWKQGGTNLPEGWLVIGEKKLCCADCARTELPPRESGEEG